MAEGQSSLGPPRAATGRAAPGTVLIRQGRGGTHRVIAMDSDSPIAGAVTSRSRDSTADPFGGHCDLRSYHRGSAEATVESRQPPDLTVIKLTRRIDLPPLCR